MEKKLALRTTILTGMTSVIMLASPAFSQDRAPQVREDLRDAPEVIIVTATGRQAAIQDIPVAVTAVTGATLQNAGVTDVRSLQQVAPSYKVATGESNAAGTSIAIRGIGTGSNNPGFEAAVGVFIDGVYRSRSGVALAELPELERIEVLRGPQGTLYGRNTSAGAVSVVTAGPKFEQTTYGRIEYGDYNHMLVNLGITGPVTEHTALRLEGGYTSRDGSLTDVNSGKTLNDRNRWFLRGQSLSEIGDAATLRVIVDAAGTDELCCFGVHVETKAGLTGGINSIAGLSGLTGVPTVDPEARQVAVTPGGETSEIVDEWGISTELNWDLGANKLTWIGSYRDWGTARDQDIDFSGMDRAYRDDFLLDFKTHTQEVRFNGQAGKVNWLVGAFYAGEKIGYTDTIRFGKDGARYTDLNASGVSLTMAQAGLGSTNPCTGTTDYIRAGSTVYGSLGSGAGSIYQQIVCPGLYQSVYNATLPQVGGNTALADSIARSTALSVSTTYGNQIAATAPKDGDGQNNDFSSTHTQSFAFFTHNEIAVSERLNLTVGLRYSAETKDLYANLNATGSGCNALQNTTLIGGVASANTLSKSFENSALGGFNLLVCNPVVNTRANGIYNDKHEEDAWSGTLSARFNLSDERMVYATLALGYKGGGYNMDRSAFTVTPTQTTAVNIKDWLFNAEFNNNLELGWKFSGLPGRTTLNGAIFNQTITDFQVTGFTGFNFFAFNVPHVISRGVELDMIARPVSGLTLNAGLLYNEAFVDGKTKVRNITFNDGQVLSGAPKWTVTGGLTYRGLITPKLGYMVYVDSRYVSEYITQLVNEADSGSTRQRPYTLTNFRLGIGAPDRNWGFEFWVRNLTDEFYYGAALGVPEQTGNYAVYPGEPRSMGITLRARF